MKNLRRRLVSGRVWKWFWIGKHTTMDRMLRKMRDCSRLLTVMTRPVLLLLGKVPFRPLGQCLPRQLFLVAQSSLFPPRNGLLDKAAESKFYPICILWILLTLRIVLSGEDTFEKDLSKSPTLVRGKQGSKMDMMMMMMDQHFIQLPQGLTSKPLCSLDRY